MQFLTEPEDKEKTSKDPENHGKRNEDHSKQAGGEHGRTSWRTTKIESMVDEMSI